MSVHGFLVGIEKYEDSRLDVLGPARDAIEMAKWLLNLAPPEQIHLFVQPLPLDHTVSFDARQAELQGELYADIVRLREMGVDIQETGSRDRIEKFWQRELAREVASPSKLLIYWAGHGITGSKRSRIFLYGDYDQDVGAPIFHATNFLNELDTQKFAAFESKIFIADVCGNFLRAPPHDHINDVANVARQNTIAYFAARIGEYAKSRDGRGVFTGLLLPILQSCAGWPTEDELVGGIEKAIEGTDVLPFKLGGRTPTEDIPERQIGKPNPKQQSAPGSAPFAIDARRLAAHCEDLRHLFTQRMSVHEGRAITTEAAATWYRPLYVRKRTATDHKSAVASNFQGHEREKELETSIVEAINALGGGARVIVLGGGGSGKTTATLHLGMQAANAIEGDPGAPIPIYVELAPFDAGRSFGGGFERLLQMTANAAARLGLDRQKLEILWRDGAHPLLFLFDGLNEVPPEYQESCLLAIREIASRGRPHRYFVTSRPGSGAAEKLMSSEGQFIAYDTLPVKQSEVRAYLRARGLTDLYERLGDQLRSLAGTPFLLMALAQSCALLKPGELPSNLGELYRRFIDDYIFKKREPAKPNAPTLYDYLAVKRPLCAFLAEMMTAAGGTRLIWNDGLEDALALRLQAIHDAHRRKRRVMPVDDYRVLDLCDELVSNGLLERVPHENGYSVAFSHHSIQEYFTAVADNINGTSAEAIAMRISPLRWHQIVFRWQASPRDTSHPYWMPTIMLAGLLDDASPLLKSLRNHQPVLAADCLRAASRVDPALRVELLAEWTRLLDNPLSTRRWVGCLCLGGAGAASSTAISRLGELAIARAKSLADTRDSRPAIAALAIVDPAGGELTRRIIASVESDTSCFNGFDLPLPTERDIAAELLIAAWIAVERDTIACKRLIRILAHKQWRTEINRVFEEADEPTRIKIEELRNAVNEVPKNEVISTNFITPDELRQIQRESEADFETRVTILVDAPIQTVITFLTSNIWQDRKAAAATILARNAPEAFDPLIKALIEERIEHVAEYLARAAAHQMTNGATLRAFKERLSGDDTHYLFTLDSALRGSFVSRMYNDALCNAFESHGVKLRNSGAYYSGDRWFITPYQSDTNALVQRYSVIDEQGALRVYRLGIRGRVAAVLQYVDHVETYEILETSIRSPDPSVRAAAIKGMVALAGSSRVESISWIAFLDDADPMVRFAAVTALTKLLGPAVAVELSKRLVSEVNSAVAEQIIEELGQIDSDDAVDGLITGLLSLRIDKSRVREKLWNSFDDSSLEPGDIAAWGGRTPGYAEMFHKALQTPRGSTRTLARMSHALLEGKEDEREIAALEIGRWMRDAAGSRTDFPYESNLVSTLLKSLSSDQSLRLQGLVTIALRWSKTDSVIDAIFDGLTATDLDRRATSVVAIGRLGNEYAAERLRIIAQSDESPFIRILAVGALRQVGLVETLPEGAANIVVKEALSDQNGRICHLARATLEDVPGAWDTFFGPVYQALNASEPNKAVELLEARLAFPLSDDVREGHGYHLLALTLIQLERLEESLAALHRAASLMFWSDDIFSLQAGVYGRLERWSEAQAAAQKAADLDPKNGRHHHAVGWYAYCAGDFCGSLRASMRAVRCDRGLIEARYNIGIARLASGAIDKAQIAYRRAIDASHSDQSNHGRIMAGALGDLDTLMRSRTDLEDAIEMVRALFTTAT